MRTFVLPTAPLSYSRPEEQVNRDRVRQGIANSVAREALIDENTNQPLFFGQTHAKMVGTNSALSVANVTITHLPLPTVSMTNFNLVESGEFKAAYAMDVEVTYNIYHSVAGAGLASVTAYISEWDGSIYPSEFFSELNSMDMTKLWGLSKTVMFSITTGQMIRLRVQHNDGIANTFDLTKSFMFIKQLTRDPKVLVQ